MKKAKGSKGLQGRACVCVLTCVRGSFQWPPGASRTSRGLQGLPGASRGLGGVCVRVSGRASRGLQGAPGASRGLQGRVCVCVCVSGGGLQGPPRVCHRLPEASRGLQGPPGASWGGPACKPPTAGTLPRTSPGNHSEQPSHSEQPGPRRAGGSPRACQHGSKGFAWEGCRNPR